MKNWYKENYTFKITVIKVGADDNPEYCRNGHEIGDVFYSQTKWAEFCLYGVFENLFESVVIMCYVLLESKTEKMGAVFDSCACFVNFIICMKSFFYIWKNVLLLNAVVDNLFIIRLGLVYIAKGVYRGNEHGAKHQQNSEFFHISFLFMKHEFFSCSTPFFFMYA